MVFSSVTFLFVFLPVFIVGYYLLHPRYRTFFLLAGSLLFYWWGEPSFLIVMAISIAWNYLCGVLIPLCSRRSWLKKLVLFFSVGVNICILGYYKYYNFLVGILNSLIPSIQIPLRNIALPIGISFFTFQGMSYVIDVYRGQVKPQRNPLIIATYISMFPQLIAGPIVRYSDIEQSLISRHVCLDDFYEGVRRFVLGLGKKVIIANTMALQADRIWGTASENLTCAVAWLGAVFYMLQIYYDFSGYSDMAIGLGRMLGFGFVENFDHPYISKSVKEFWRRWHISLSTFFRDYVYIPLGGNRRGNVYLHLIIVFLLTGLWHGASWNFVIWGLWHGVFLILERLLHKGTRKKPLAAVFGHIYTLLVVIIGWVIFRADTLTAALEYLRVMFGIKRDGAALLGVMFYLDRYTVFIVLLGILFSTDCIIAWVRKIRTNPRLAGVFPALECVLLMLLMGFCAVETMASTYNPFIYFRF